MKTCKIGMALAMALGLLALNCNGSGLIISEFMASNSSGIKDSFGDRSDWIEIYNDSDTEIPLSGWTLSDEETKPAKWFFPSTNLVAGAYVVVFASDRNISKPGQEMHANFKLSADGEYLGLFNPLRRPVSEFKPSFPAQYSDVSYGLGCTPSESEVVLRDLASGIKYLVPEDSSVDRSWYREKYNAASWNSGTAGVGYERSPSSSTSYTKYIGTDLQSKMYNANCTCYVRMPFEMEESRKISKLVLGLHYDDGVICYLNGTEVFRDNVPDSVNWQSSANGYRPDEDVVVLKEVDITENAGLLHDGDNVLCIHAMNDSLTSSDFLMDAKLTAMVVNETKFGEAGYLRTPTPGEINSESYSDYVPKPQISVASGIKEEPFEVAMSVPVEGAIIRYTVDCTEPTATKGILYEGPIAISSNTVLRAFAYKKDAFCQRPAARSYVFIEDVIAQKEGKAPGSLWPNPPSYNGQKLDYGMDTDITESWRYGEDVREGFRQIPFVSVITSPGCLFNATSGIYVNARGEGKDWERFAQVIYMPGGEEGFNVDCGLRIRGMGSRDGENPKHSLRLFFRKEYGPGKLKYPLFGDKAADKFDVLDMRTDQDESWSRRGSAEYIITRDIFPRDLQLELGHLSTRSINFHLLLNGHYWGIYEFEERSDADYAAEYMGGEPEDYDVIKTEHLQTALGSGSLDAWESLSDMAIAGFTEEDYRKIVGRNPDGTKNPAYPVILDPTNLCDYMLIEFFIGNVDGPVVDGNYPNNYFSILNRLNPQGFKTFCYDCERAFGKGYATVDATSIIKCGSQGVSYSNPRYLHQRLCAVPEYLRVFQSRVAKLYFNGGVLTRDKAAEILLRRTDKLDKAVCCESARWGNTKSTLLTRDDHWWPELRYITNSLLNTRHSLNLMQFNNRKWYPGNLKPPAIAPNGGAVPRGSYIEVAGEHAILYTKDGSDPTTSPTARTYVGPIMVTEPMKLRCAYDPADCEYPLDVDAEFTLAEAAPFVVSEIMYMPAPPDKGSPYEAKDYEFLELYNNSTNKFYPAGQSVTGGVTFTFAKDSRPLDPKGYVVLVSNLKAFAERYETNGMYIAGEYKGHLSDDADSICLSNYNMTYSGYWFEEARGQGPSIVPKLYLIPKPNYSTKAAWKVSGRSYGSPGAYDTPEPCVAVWLLFLAGLAINRRYGK